MRRAVVAVLCTLTLFYLHGPDLCSGYRTRRYFGSSGRRRSNLFCSQKYRCSLKYLKNTTVYDPNDAFLPANATKFNLCRTGGDECTYYKGCRTRYLTGDGRTLTENLDAWTATHVGDTTTQPKPESVLMCNRAPRGISEKGTFVTIVLSIALGMATGLCLLRP